MSEKKLIDQIWKELARQDGKIIDGFPDFKPIEKIFDEVKNDFSILFNKLFLGKLSYEEYTREVNIAIQKWFGTVDRQEMKLK